MNNLKKNKLFISIIIYVIIAILIYIIKPRLMFSNNKMIPFGIEKNSTILSYPVALIIIAITVYIISQLILN